MKILLVVAELFHADERTDGRTERHDKASSHFFAILPARLKGTSYVRKCPPACLRLISVNKQFDRISIKFGIRILFSVVGQIEASLKMMQLR